MTTETPQTHAEHGGDDHGVGHIVPLRILVTTGVALLILTVVTVVTAQFDFGEANIYIALLIAGFKASLVVMFFMHLWWDRSFNAFIFVASVAFVVLFISFALTDSYEYRHEKPLGDAPAVQDRLVELAQP